MLVALIVMSLWPSVLWPSVASATPPPNEALAGEVTDASTTATASIDPEAERLRKHAERLERIDAEAQTAPGPSEPPSLWPTFLR
ncbi:MAG: hypothetical protein AAF449_01245, partial [Myxococcota bacterium]